MRLTPEVTNQPHRMWGRNSAATGRMLASIERTPNSAYNTHSVTWRCVELIDGFGNPVTRLQEAICHLHDLRSRGRVYLLLADAPAAEPVPEDHREGNETT